METSSTRMLMEVGLGVWPHLLRSLNPGRLDGIWVSHLHPDHSGDLFAAFQWAANTPGAPRLPVYGPAGWADRIGSALPMPDGAQRLAELFDIREHHDAPTSLGDLTLIPVSVRHSVPTYGLRVTHAEHVLAYSGDSGPCPALTSLAAGADIFLCEAGSTAPDDNHCTPEEAVAFGSAAKRTLLTHLAPGLTAGEAARRAPGATIARPGLVIQC